MQTRSESAPIHHSLRAQERKSLAFDLPICNACSSPQLEKKLVEFRQDILTTFFLRLLMRGLETCACGIPPFRLKSCISEVCPQSLAPVGAPVGAAATRSRIFATPASAQTWSLAPPGAPPTPSAATISPLCL